MNKRDVPSGASFLFSGRKKFIIISGSGLE